MKKRALNSAISQLKKSDTIHLQWAALENIYFNWKIPQAAIQKLHDSPNESDFPKDVFYYLKLVASSSALHSLKFCTGCKDKQPTFSISLASYA